MPAALLGQRPGEDVSLSPAGRMLASLATQFSPAQRNPMALNGVRGRWCDVSVSNGCAGTVPSNCSSARRRANTGRLCVSRKSELSAEVQLASACLPCLHASVDINGQPYCVGGYSADPTVFPLFRECTSTDVLLQLLSPLTRADIPHTSAGIHERVTELGSHAHFMRGRPLFSRAMSIAAPSFIDHGRLERKLQVMRLSQDRTRFLPEHAAAGNAATGPWAASGAAVRQGPEARPGLAGQARGCERRALQHRRGAPLRLNATLPRMIKAGGASHTCTKALTVHSTRPGTQASCAAHKSSHTWRDAWTRRLGACGFTGRPAPSALPLQPVVRHSRLLACRTLGSMNLPPSLAAGLLRLCAGIEIPL